MSPKKFFLIAAATLGLGCMQADPTGNSGDSEKELPKDNNLRAGATSSTNWPADISGGQHIAVFTKTDSALSFWFMEKGKTAFDPEFIPTKLTGMVTVYQGGTISALQTTSGTTIRFAEADTVRLESREISSLSGLGQDTLFFNLNIIVDTVETWIFGLGFDVKTKIFFKTPFSIETENRVLLRPPDVAIKGILDRSKSLPKPSLSGISELSFYIPGSPYHKAALGDSLELGPISFGEYPLRLLRVTHAAAGESGTQIEAFEVESTKANSSKDIVYVFKPGALVFTFQSNATLQVRPDWHR